MLTRVTAARAPPPNDTNNAIKRKSYPLRDAQRNPFQSIIHFNSIYLDFRSAHGNFTVSLPEGPPFFYYSDPNNCMEALQKAGFVNQMVQEMQLSWEIESAEELFDAFAEGTGRTGGFLRRQTEECLAKIREAVRQAASKYMQNNHLVLPMAALVASAEKL